MKSRANQPKRSAAVRTPLIAQISFANGPQVLGVNHFSPSVARYADGVTRVVATIYQQLYDRLLDANEIKALIGRTEDLYLDCKVWPANDSDAQRLLAKCLCGFANADGGVIVIGLEARSGPTKADPDMIQREVLVSDSVLVKSRIEALVGDLVEPGLRGVQVAPICDPATSRSGFVLVLVPPTDGSPCRSRKDSKFYLRIASGTYPMEYFQIADMFGIRHRPVLKIFLEEDTIEIQSGRPVRFLTLGIENCGRAVAKFPSIRFRCPGVGIDAFGIDGKSGFGLPLRPAEPEWTIFGGGADHVIYPGTTLKITRLEQHVKQWLTSTVTGEVEAVRFDELNFAADLAADEAPSAEQSKTIPAKEFPFSRPKI